MVQRLDSNQSQKALSKSANTCPDEGRTWLPEMVEKNEKIALSLLIRTCDHIKTEINSIGLYNASDRLGDVFTDKHHAVISEDKHLKCTTKTNHGVQDLALGLTVSDIFGLGIRHVVFQCTQRDTQPVVEEIQSKAQDAFEILLRGKMEYPRLKTTRFV